jgi:hypothetical protein
LLNGTLYAEQGPPANAIDQIALALAQQNQLS